VVKIVGFIESIPENSTFVVYRVSDGTGVVESKYWTKPGDNNKVAMISAVPCHDDAQSKSRLTNHGLKHRENCYVKIFTNPRDFEGRRELLIYEIKLITDLNEITYHELDVILVHLQQTKGPVPGSTSGPAATSGVNPLKHLKLAPRLHLTRPVPSPPSHILPEGLPQLIPRTVSLFKARPWTIRWQTKC